MRGYVRSSIRPKVLISLFDYSGTWSKPFYENGWKVVRVDMAVDPDSEHQGLCIVGDITKLDASCLRAAAWQAQCGKTGVFTIGEVEAWVAAMIICNRYTDVDAVISATPCTAFTRAGTGHWKKWDQDGTTEAALALFDHQHKLIQDLSPGWWALENPPGRLANKSGTGLRQDVLGPPAYQFHPWEFVPGQIYKDSTPHEEAYTKQTYLWGTFKPPKKNVLRQKPDMSKYGKHGRIQWLGSKNKRLRSKTPTLFSQAFYEANK